MTYNASERKDVRRAEKASKLAEAQSAEIVRGLMSTTAGRAWVLSKLEATHVFATSFNLDLAQMAFNEGERNIGLQLLNDVMRHCPDLYILMMRESNERYLASERSRSQDGDGRDQESSADSNFDDRGNWIGEGEDPRQPGAASH